jgi:hypothetical protein
MPGFYFHNEFYEDKKHDLLKTDLHGFIVPLNLALWNHFRCVTARSAHDLRILAEEA